MRIHRAMLVTLLIQIQIAIWPVQAQVSVSDTPIAVEIITETPVATDFLAPTATFEPTEVVPLLEAAAPSVDINVRNAPDVSGARLGTLEQGRQYPVRGRYFSWFLFDYESSPNGTAWVFGDLVNIVGDASTIPAVDPSAGPTADPAQLSQTQTSEAILLTPGLSGTATAQAREVIIPTEASTNAVNASGFLPTFTPPAEIVSLRDDDVRELADTADSDLIERTLGVIAQGNLPPIVPIGILGGLGLLSLLFSIIRRL